jgi:hypothetical protein
VTTKGQANIKHAEQAGSDASVNCEPCGTSNNDVRVKSLGQRTAKAETRFLLAKARTTTPAEASGVGIDHRELEVDEQEKKHVLRGST